MKPAPSFGDLLRICHFFTAHGEEYVNVLTRSGARG